MHPVLVLGAGKIGALVSFLLAYSQHYEVHLADQRDVCSHINLPRFPHCSFVQLNADTPATVSDFIKKNKIKAVVSCLPFFCNVPIAQIAAEQGIHYFDLTEDVQTTQTVRHIAKNAQSAFVPQCGLAPGFISIVAQNLMQHFTELDTVKLRVGALPANTSNALHYALTWSTDGLINEYGNPCQAVERGREIVLSSLEGLEEIQLDGLVYEAFNTSGGIGSLIESYNKKLQNLNYKTIRYPGHCEKIKFLMNDLNLNHDRATLKKILEQAIPQTDQDVVLVYVSATGKQGSRFSEMSYFQKFYPKIVHGQPWTAIQLTTASSLCCIIDLVMAEPERYQGFIRQEQFSLDEFLNNQFGQYYRNTDREKHRDAYEMVNNT